MADKRKILIQYDTDPQPSVFDRVVAVDGGADEVFSYGGIRPDQVRDLTHGAIFTRSPASLNHTAIFIGGRQDLRAAEDLLKIVVGTFFGPLRVSVMLDPNGANTTAAAAVLSASRHLGSLRGRTALVLGATGPVGQQVCRLLVQQGATVRIGSRSAEKAGQVRDLLIRSTGAATETMVPCAAATPDQVAAVLPGAEVVVAAGAAGALLLPTAVRHAAGKGVRVLVDLNAVPPAGIEGMGAADAGVLREGAAWFGPIAVGGLKMKIHRAAIARLFTRNDAVLDAEQIFAIGTDLSA